jgi:hypothetical protein
MAHVNYDKQIEILNSTLWESRALRPRVDEWLSNFATDTEKEYALYMLSRLMFFNSSNIRHLLKSLYRDLFRYPIIEKIRRTNGDTMDERLIESLYREELEKTRFLGVGNPSESGVHLLYYFRQENRIPKDLFVNTDDVVIYEKDSEGNLQPKLRDKYKKVKRFVFIDDLCGSGDQATSDSSNVKRCVNNLRVFAKDAKVSYLMLFGMTKGIEIVRNSGLYHDAQAIVELDESYKCFSDQSRYFNDGIHNKEIAKDIAYHYGCQIWEKYFLLLGKDEATRKLFADKHALGFKGSQLLISMHHNTPDNTLPIIWFDEVESIWKPIFKRYNKVY